MMEGLRVKNRFDRICIDMFSNSEEKKIEEANVAIFRAAVIEDDTTMGRAAAGHLLHLLSGHFLWFTAPALGT